MLRKWEGYAYCVMCLTCSEIHSTFVIFFSKWGICPQNSNQNIVGFQYFQKMTSVMWISSFPNNTSLLSTKSAIYRGFVWVKETLILASFHCWVPTIVTIWNSIPVPMPEIKCHKYSLGKRDCVCASVVTMYSKTFVSSVRYPRSSTFLALRNSKFLFFWALLLIFVFVHVIDYFLTIQSYFTLKLLLRCFQYILSLVNSLKTHFTFCYIFLTKYLWAFKFWETEKIILEKVYFLLKRISHGKGKSFYLVTWFSELSITVIKWVE